MNRKHQNDRLRDPYYIKELILSSAMQDKKSFFILFKATKIRIFNFIYRILKNRADAEDVLQNTYISIWRFSSSYRDVTDPWGWMLTIARNHALDLVIKRKQHQFEECNLQFAKDQSPDPEMQILISQKLAFVEFCFTKLDARSLELMRDFHLIGASYKEISARHNLPLNTVRTLLRRGLIKLRDYSIQNSISTMVK